jgi:putative membrane protein
MRLATIICTSMGLMFAPGFATAQGNKLTDPQIAHIAYSAGQIDIQAAQLALKKSKNKEVRDLVRMTQAMRRLDDPRLQ